MADTWMPRQTRANTDVPQQGLWTPAWGSGSDFYSTQGRLTIASQGLGQEAGSLWRKSTRCKEWAQTIHDPEFLHKERQSG